MRRAVRPAFGGRLRHPGATFGNAAPGGAEGWGSSAPEPRAPVELPNPGCGALAANPMAESARDILAPTAA